MKKTKKALKAVILVGGPGTRLQPLTYDTPKPMVPVLNKPFLEHTIAYLKQFGIKDIILALNYLPEVIQSYFGDGSGLGINLTYSVEKNPLGTAGAVKNAEQYLDSTFIVLNGDIFTDLDIAGLVDFHHSKKSGATIALRWVEDVSGLGVVEIDDDKNIKRFVEKPSPGEIGSHWINAGVYIIEPEMLKYVPANAHFMFEKGLFPLLIDRHEPLHGFTFDGYWVNMTSPREYFSLSCDLLTSKSSSPLIPEPANEIRCGGECVIAPSATMKAPVVTGARCRISRGALVKGPVVIGADCLIENGAIIENAVLMDNVHVGANAGLHHCIICHHTDLEPGRQVTDCVVHHDGVMLLPR